MTTRILVTGGCGFVGEPVVRQLVQHGHRVTAYDDCSRSGPDALGLLGTEVEVVTGDVRDGPALERALRAAGTEIVVHLAALHFIPDCNRDPELCLSTNVLGTQVVLEAVGRCPGVQGFVFASTAAVYGPSPLPHSESDARGPTDVYGSSKLAAEQLVQAFGLRTGLPTGIARLFNVFGPRETNPHLIPAVITQARRGRVLSLGNLLTSRDYVFTEDVAAAFRALVGAVHNGSTELCNVGTGRQRTGSEVVDAVADALGITLTVEVDGERIRPSDRPVLCAEVALARARLGWAPATTFREGIRAAVEEPDRARVSA